MSGWQQQHRPRLSTTDNMLVWVVIGYQFMGMRCHWQPRFMLKFMFFSGACESPLKSYKVVIALAIQQFALDRSERAINSSDDTFDIAHEQCVSASPTIAITDEMKSFQAHSLNESQWRSPTKLDHLGRQQWHGDDGNLTLVLVPPQHQCKTENRPTTGK